MTHVLLLHGPNLNLLGKRPHTHYGAETLPELNQRILNHAEKLGLQLSIHQRNGEGELIDLIHAALDEKVSYIIINPAAYTHNSIAIRDALEAVDIPFIEVHLSNLYQRESFRQHSTTAELAMGIISGLGGDGYLLALQAIANHLTSQ